MRALAGIFVSWLPIGLAVTGLMLAVYLGAQQTIRQSFNDISVQNAEDAAAQLSAGKTVADVAPGDVPIRTSIAPFVLVYDGNGKPLGGNGTLDGAQPVPPQGVFDNAPFWRWGHTWQPTTEVRIDAAIVPFSTDTISGFVLGGRNMRLMQNHITRIGWLMLLTWVVIMGTTFIAKGFARYFS